MLESCGCGVKEGYGDGMKTGKKDPSARQPRVHIGRCWQHRKNKDRKTFDSHILFT